MSVILYLAAGLIVLAGTIALYFAGGAAYPHTAAEWAAFGTYVGGVAGPLLSFVALVAVARTMHLQNATLELELERQSADQHLRWLDAIYSDIKEVLDTRVSGDTTLRSVLDGEVEASQVDPKRLTARLDNLMQLVAFYCRAVDLYRTNISEFFDLQIYVDRGGRLLDAIKPFHSYLGGMIQGTIEFCDMHLKGEEERANSEAMKRSSRHY